MSEESSISPSESEPIWLQPYKAEMTDIPFQEGSTPEFRPYMPLDLKTPNGDTERVMVLTSIKRNDQLCVVLKTQRGEEQIIPYETLKESQSDAADQDAFTPETQFAINKVKKFLNERHRKTVEAKEAGKKGSHDLDIAMFEALRGAADRADFSNPVTYSIKTQSGREVTRSVSVEEYLDRLIQSTSDRAESLAEKDDKQSRQQLERTHQFFDIVEETLKAVESAQTVSKQESTDDSKNPDDQHPSIEDSVIEDINKGGVFVDKNTGKEFKLNRIQTQLNGEKFITFSSSTGPPYGGDIPVNEYLDLKKNWEWRPDEPKPDQPQPDGNNDDNKVDNKNITKEPENSWLDPRRIQELKDKYRDMLENEKYQRERIFVTKDQQGEARAFMSDITPMSDYYKDIVKTHLIESEIKNAIKLASDVGKALEEPSEEIKEQMAEMLDMPDSEINSLAAKADEQAGRPKAKFEVDQSVSHNGEEWKVLGVIKGHPSGNRVSLIKDDGTATIVFEKDLLSELGYQPTSQEQEKINLDRLKPYFKRPPKVKLPSGEVILGRVGYSSTRGKAYVSGPDGKWMPDLVEIDEFLSWQNEVLDSDKKFQVGQEVQVVMGTLSKGGKTESGWKVEGFEERDISGGYREGKEILVTISKGSERKKFPQDLIEWWQMAPESQDDYADRMRPLIGKRVNITFQDGEVVNNCTIVGYKEDEKLAVIENESGNRVDYPVEDLLNAQIDIIDDTANVPPAPPAPNNANTPPSPPNANMRGNVSTIPLSFLERTKKWYDGLSNSKKAAALSIGFVVFALTKPISIPAYVTVKRRHKRVLKRRELEAAERA